MSDAAGWFRYRTRRGQAGGCTAVDAQDRAAVNAFDAVVPGQAAGNHQLVEAGGQHIRGFRSGLDYAFIRNALANARMRSVLSR